MKRIIATFLVGLTLFSTCLSIGCGTTSTKSTATNHYSVVQQKSEEVDSDTDKENEMSPEEEAALIKEQEESLTVYADMISEIQQDIPELKVNYIVNNSTGGKDLSIDMNMQESKDATYYIAAKLTSIKETLLNLNEITDIIIMVRNPQNQEDCPGVLMFKNESGIFNPVVNTL